MKLLALFGIGFCGVSAIFFALIGAPISATIFLALMLLCFMSLKVMFK